jgi:hypothetical protein
MQTYDTIVDYENERVLKVGIILTPGKGVYIGFAKDKTGDKLS